jgi:hypothetical protein
MKARVILFAIVTAGSACGGHTGKMVVDTPIRPYQKPDISEITGIDEDDADAGSGSAATPAPAGAPAPAPAAAPAPKK